MKGLRTLGNFLVTLLINLLLQLKWSIPAWLLLACHKLLDWSVRWFWIALGAWVGGIVLWMAILGWASRCASEKDPPRPNKNPYSAGAGKFRKPCDP